MHRTPAGACRRLRRSRRAAAGGNARTGPESGRSSLRWHVSCGTNLRRTNGARPMDGDAEISAFESYAQAWTAFKHSFLELLLIAIVWIVLAVPAGILRRAFPPFAF